MGDSIKAWHDDMEAQAAWEKRLTGGLAEVHGVVQQLEHIRDTMPFTQQHFELLRDAIQTLDKITGNKRWVR